MKKATLPILFGGISIVIIIISLILAGGNDKVGPKISFSEECITVFGDDNDIKDLLNGVTAIDEEDGDVSESLRIQNVFILDEEGQIVVNYSAKDSKNNISQAKRTIEYNGTKDYISFSVLGEEVFGEDEESLQNVTNDETDESQSESQDETSSNEQDSTSEQETDVNNETDASQETSSSQNINNNQPVPEPETVTPNPIDREQVNATGVPQIRMKYQTLTINVGGNFYFMDALGEWYDDKDDVSRRVIVGGTYDVNTPGTYELTYYVTDSDGNVSNIEKFTLIVQ